MKKRKNEELGRPSVQEFKQQDKLPLVIVLENVRSMHNTGSIFRTSDAFAVKEILLCGFTGTPPHREIEKTALGATRSVDWTYHATVSEALNRLRSEGYVILAVEQVEGSVSLDNFIPDRSRNYALVFGNEVNGVSEEAIALSDTCIEIPQFGTKHSFNIVVSTGIVLWDIFTKLNKVH